MSTMSTFNNKKCSLLKYILFIYVNPISCKKIKNVNAQINFIHSSVFCDYFFFNLELITTL